MRELLRGLGIFAVAGLAAGGLSACGMVQGQTYEDESTLSGKITSVRLENGSGGVTLNGTEGGGKLSLHRKLEYWGDRPEDPTHRIEGGVLVLKGCDGDSRCSVNYTVDVPAGIAVSGQVSSGAVHLAGVGAVKVATSSGRIEMEGVSGAVDVRTSNGRITGRDIKGGEIQAQTSNGAIDLTPATPQNVRATTSNGDITLTVPPGSYQVAADSNNGGEDIGVTSDPAGRYRLGLKTSNGAITVRTS
ncbi:DUF4097 family beta strand repeat-containing protein [Streptomyces nitrosporeus]|uniref:DUF4097 domain-containing protein n=1 Tax=Streptomyces nitrosporeus TaxID=28894 RepID=A0A5J6FBD6_9ACTN|nr:DUF4097 family beta strand repeat-containing protein [Streptomyces nitrosporeus]QEU73067.1 hypothetical protein CP967_14565 [Streptomyces nitrosporeus]GGZ17540.1 hypothetical protein GCM10010327_55630 [Streptomyces nitrosporeus]